MDEKNKSDRLIKILSDAEIIAKCGEAAVANAHEEGHFCDGEFDKERYLAVLENTAVSIRNALSVTLAASSFLKTGICDKNERELLPYVAMINHSQRRLLHLAENIENMIIYEKREDYFRGEFTDLNILCGNLVKTVNSMLTSSGVKIHFRSLCGSALIISDFIKIEAMLLNLLCECIKNTEKNGRIELILSKNAGFFIITLTGGKDMVETEDMDSAYEVRQRINSCSSAGADMDMASAQNIARQHGGNIFASWGERGKLISVALLDRLPDKSEAKSHSSIYQPDGMSRIQTGLADVLEHAHFMEPFDE